MANALITLDLIRAALSLNNFDPAAAQLPMIPGTRPREAGKTEQSRQAGVLVLLYPEHDEWCFVLTRRTDRLRGHSGQISFPGGRRDSGDRTFVDTALRETCEELGVCDANIEVLGALTPIYIPPSDFEVHPIVAALDDRPKFHPNPDEVAEVFAVTLSALVNDAYKRIEQWPFNGVQVDIPFYAFNGHKVWGATAIMLSEFEARLRAVLPQGEINRP